LFVDLFSLFVQGEGSVLQKQSTYHYFYINKRTTAYFQAY